MRDPINLKEVLYKTDDIEVIQINNIPEYKYIDYDLVDDKELRTYFTDLERAIRTSFEYNTMVKYLREHLNMNSCSFYENVNNIESFKIKIEIHHEPFSLYDICQIVFNKRMYYKESLDIEAVAKEVMWLHYKTMIGLIPLSETVHELVHNSYLLIPVNKVYGNIRQFIENYQFFMDPTLVDTLNNIYHMTDTYTEMDNNTKLLDKHYVYFDLTGAYELPVYNEVAEMMQSTINNIKSNIQIKKTLVTFGKLIENTGVGIDTFHQDEYNRKSF